MSDEDELSFAPYKSACISKGFEQLVATVTQDPDATHYDVLIVGSGYGGAIAARTFAGLEHGNKDVRVAVLERGNEYLPGKFPANITEVPGHVRFDRNRGGLFDFRPGPEVGTVLANGLGGGSLINAGVMEVPTDDVFTSGWPAELSVGADWADYYDRARDLLGASHNGVPNTIESHPDGLPKKFETIRDLAINRGESFRPAAITVAMDSGTNRTGVQLNRCLRCGDCATGCNYGAKESLDLNLLVEAFANHADIYTGATVLDIERDSDNNVWIVHSVHTHHQLRARHGERVPIRAKNVVIAAGALGSTEILSRSKAKHGLGFSHRLGWGCSTNGDMLAVDYHTDTVANAVADAVHQPSTRIVGPTITGIVDMRDSAGVLIEELAVPAALRRVFTELFGTVNTLHSLAERDCSTHREGYPDDDIYAIGSNRIDSSMLYAVMGDDGASGRMEFLQDGEDYEDHRDGTGRIRWEGLADHQLFDRQMNAVARLTADTGGRSIANPAWQPLPENMSFLIGGRHGPLTTVHPLGGCPMGDDVEQGVVDHLGRVFNPDGVAGGHYPGLAVLDGAIIPTALGTNPALTIAAVSLRAAEALVGDWGFTGSQNVAAGGPFVRSVFRDTNAPFRPIPTEVQFMERMAGVVKFRTDGDGIERRVVELTLRFQDKPLRELTAPPGDGGDATLLVDANHGEPANDWNRVRLESPPARQMEARLDAIALFNAPLSGKLRIFRRKRTCSWWRLLRAGRAYLCNRGLRDIWQEYFHGDGSGPGFLARLLNGVALATRAGEVRQLIYDLEVGEPFRDDDAISLIASKIRGSKRFTYARRANPWNQLMALRLDQFPGLALFTCTRRLTLDLTYLARIGVPLFRITRQNDGATALAELASFLGYFVRLMLGIHIWSFRSPDPELEPRTPNLNPGIIEGLPIPHVHPLYIGLEHDQQVYVQLTRYPRYGSTSKPILMIHGYSASGTTFAHHAVNPNFASHFWHQGRDVWVVDLRTSPAMPTATYGWHFEDVAYRDIPRAVEYIYQHTNSKIDVIAHCMGAVMFSMAVLHADRNLVVDPFENARRALPGRIGRLALTQVGPLVVFSPANIFRAYVIRYLREFLPDSYTFRPRPNPSLADQLLDRLLATVPYPVAEFDTENPRWPWKRTEWVRTRHRMDALYGRDFNVNNVPSGVLKYIDDLFGPLSINTVTQTTHFARFKTITNRRGRNTFVSRLNFENNWNFPTRSIHGRENGLSDVSTVYRMQQILSDAGRPYDFRIIDGAGHQDPLIGNGTQQMLAYIDEFFSGTNDPGNPVPPETRMVAFPPWIGPIVTEESPAAVSIRIGTRPTLDRPAAVVLLRVSVDNGQVRNPDGNPFTLAEILADMWIYISPELEKNDWDAFLMPGPLLKDGGNAVLVLVVYSEAAELQNRDFGQLHNYFVTNPGDDPFALRVEPDGWSPQDPSGDPEIAAPVCREIALAAFTMVNQVPFESPGTSGGGLPIGLRPGEPGVDVPAAPGRDVPAAPGVDVPAAPGVDVPAAEEPRPVTWDATGEAGMRAFIQTTHGLRDRAARFLRLSRALIGEAALNRVPETARKLRDRAARFMPRFRSQTGDAPLQGVAGIARELLDLESPLTFERRSLIGNAVLDRVAETDHELLDGVVPYRPDPNPPLQPAVGGTRFAFASCQYPAGFLDAVPTYESYQRLASRLDAADREGFVPKFVIMTGDQVYVDATAGLYDASRRDDAYEQPYRPLLRNHHVRTVLRRLPSFMMLDDHEIVDNWEPILSPVDHPENARPRDEAIRAYRRHQRGVAFPAGSLSYEFRFDGYPFLMLDTRTGRNPRRADSIQTDRIISAADMTVIKNFLSADDGPKFVVTPSILLPRHRRAAQWDRAVSALHSDGWDGYPHSLHEVLSYIADNEIQHVVFLSGDEHLPCYAEIDVTSPINGGTVRMHSIHTAATHAPFPFANGRAEDFVEDDDFLFKFNNSADYRCVVRAEFPVGPDGFTFLKPWHDGAGWKLDCEFAGGGSMEIDI
jgi:cholesterol oxidase